MVPPTHAHEHDRVLCLVTGTLWNKAAWYDEARSFETSHSSHVIWQSLPVRTPSSKFGLVLMDFMYNSALKLKMVRHMRNGMSCWHRHSVVHVVTVSVVAASCSSCGGTYVLVLATGECKKS